MVAFLSANLVHGFQTGDKLKVVKLIFPVKTVDVPDFSGVPAGNNAENIVFHIVLIEEPGSIEHPVGGTGAVTVFPVQIVQRSGTIQGQTHQKAIFCQKSGPFLIDA